MSHHFTNVTTCDEHPDCIVLYEAYRGCPVCKSEQEYEERMERLQVEMEEVQDALDAFDDMQNA